MSERFNLITGTYTFIFICLSVGNVALRFNFDTLLVIPLSCIAFYLYRFKVQSKLVFIHLYRKVHFVQSNLRVVLVTKPFYEYIIYFHLKCRKPCCFFPFLVPIHYLWWHLLLTTQFSISKNKDTYRIGFVLIIIIKIKTVKIYELLIYVIIIEIKISIN